MKGNTASIRGDLRYKLKKPTADENRVLFHLIYEACFKSVNMFPNFMKSVAEKVH